MKRINKIADSQIIVQNLIYKKNSSNKKIREILEKEQDYYCAYTEFPLSREVAVDIDHFNPTLKNTARDNYNNWFAISTVWNREKSKTWKEPILHPSANDFEERVLYDKVTHIYYSNKEDKEAENLILLLKLNDFGLASQRKDYIKELKSKLSKGEKSIEQVIKSQKQIKYRRAVETTFDIKL